MLKSFDSLPAAASTMPTRTESLNSNMSWEDFEREMLEPEATNEPLSNLKTRLEELTQKERIPISSNVLHYWEIFKLSDPEVSELAFTALATPVTQVSVERAFSALALILSHLRTRLSSKTLELLLLIKLNQDLLDEINLSGI